MDIEKHKQLQQLARYTRIDILKMIEKAGQGHIGGSLSIVELLCVLYGKQLTYDIHNPNDPNRDRVILSKGHAGAGLYSILAQVGFFDKDVLMTMNQGGTTLPSHPDRHKIPGVDMTTGSLGQGVSVAAGIAKGLLLSKNTAYVYTIVGDGELNEGQCWEAFQFIAHYRLNNCIVFIDDNKKQIDGWTKDVMNPFDIAHKMQAFGFETKRVNGHDLEAIDQAINEAKQNSERPTCIVLDTVKGYGVPLYEEMEENHSVKFNDALIQKNREAIQVLEDMAKECER